MQQETTPEVDTGIFQKVWAVGVILATVFAVPVALWGKERPWMLAIPVFIGVGWTLYFEFSKGSQLFETKGPVSSLPRHFKGLFHYRKSFGLFIEEHQVVEEQMDLFGPPQPVAKTQRKAIVIRDEKGKRFTLVECDRFMAKVNSVIEEDVKKAAEHAFKTGWKRLETLAETHPELVRIFQDPLVLEAVKGDFSSNVSICIAKSSEEAVKQFIEESRAAEQTARFRIAPEKLKTPK